MIYELHPRDIYDGSRGHANQGQVEVILRSGKWVFAGFRPPLARESYIDQYGVIQEHSQEDVRHWSGFPRIILTPTPMAPGVPTGLWD